MQTLSYPNGISQKPGRSLATIALVGSLHLILIYAVLAALDIVPAPFIPNATHTRVIDATVKSKLPPPPPIHTTFVKPPITNDVPIPNIPIDRDSAGSTITATSGNGSVSQTVDVSVPAQAVAATHTIPSYPALDRRLDHEGTVLLAVTIDPQGNVGDASIMKSSGFDGLDEAAVSWVKEHWRYKPATHNGNAVTATSRAEVTFRLTQN